MTDDDPVVRSSLDEFLDAVAGAEPGAAAGAGAVVATAIAAGLVSMCARRSVETWDGASAAAGQAERLRSRASALLGEAEAAHSQAVDRLGRRTEASPEGAEQRDWQLGEALRRAAHVPALCAEVAADVAELGAETAAHCDPGCRADAVAACRLAEASTMICSHLVEVNLAVGADQQLRSAAAGFAERARAARERASGAQ
jgi:formiminotetrahydrofolate cyclodeaminase